MSYINATDKDVDALFDASRRGDNTIIDILIETGSNVNAVDKDGKNALMLASEMGKDQTVELLINSGSDVTAVDTNGKTALMLASERGHDKSVELLINSDSDVTAVDKSGKTALMLASERGHDKTVELLINRDSDVTAVDTNGKTALMLASEMGNDQTVELLINSGSDVTAVDTNGNTALMLALERGHDKTVDLLIKIVSDVTAVDKSGKTALMLASERGHDKTVEMFFNIESDGTACEKDCEKCLGKPQPSTEDDMMKDALVKQVLDLDIPEDLIKKTLQKRLEDKGTTFESAEALTEAILKDNFSRPSASLAGDPFVSTQLKERGIEVKELLRCRNCYDKDVDTKFKPCGHLSCSKCGFDADVCPNCGSHIKAKQNISYIVILALIIKVKTEDTKKYSTTSKSQGIEDQTTPIRGRLQERHYKLLQQNYPYLIDEIDGKFLTGFLFSKNIISEDDMQYVKSKPTRTKRTEALLKLILHAGPRRAFPEFINSLRKDYPQVVDRLQNYDDEIKR